MNEVNSGIYKITNTVTGKFYIGSAVNFDKRFYLHRNRLKCGNHRNSKLQRAWDKYGNDAFEFSVIERIPDKETLLTAEQQWLDKTNAANVGYNICKIANSRLGVKASTETKKRQSESATGFVHSEKSKKKMSESKMGIKMPPRSDEHRDKISKNHKGKVVSEETKAKLKEARNRRPPPSKETLRKMSESMRKTLANKREKLRVEVIEDATKKCAESTVTRDLLNGMLLKVM